MGGFKDLEAQFDRVNAKRKGDQFERVCKWFLESDPTYQPLLRRVWLWKDWPGRKGIDAGIDLVAEDHAGKLWAIQAKAYDPAYSISKRDIDKFVAESSRATFTYRVLIGTTDKRHHLATRLMDDLGIPFIGLTQLCKADDYLDWPAEPAALHPAKPPKPKEPWDYQQSAINDVVKGFKNADRGQLIMACGTGKTLTAWFITEQLAAERTLILVPSLSLLKQTMREWHIANPQKPFAALPVCSDGSVGDLGEDAAVSHTSDLGVPVTTDPVEIAEFLRKRSGPRVVFSTYQSSPQIAAAFALGRVPVFDLVIADEAHRVAGPVGPDFGTVLDAKAIKAKRRLFMTATPRYFTGRMLREAKESDYEVASMDDPIRFGTEFHRLSFSEAIDRKLLTDYQVAIIGVDDATYRDWAERGALVTLDGKKNTDARSLAGQIGLAKAMKKFDLRRVISFHSRVKASREFAASMPAVLDWMPARQRPKGVLWSNYASGEMSAGDRDVLIQHLKRLDDGERGLLANARCLAEGVDVPALDGVAFIDPRRSEVDIVQAVGRAIRKSQTKTVGTIIIPVFIDTDTDPAVALSDSAFKPVWDVIKALRAHDDELGRQLDEWRRELGRRRVRVKLPTKIRCDLPRSVGTDFAHAFNVRLVEKTTASWEFWYGLAERFAQDQGHTAIPVAYVMDDARLGEWANAQRDRYARGRMTPEHERRLSELPGWTWDPLDERWQEGFGRLQRYVARHGTSLVSHAYVEPDGFRLGTWVKVQRRRQVAGILKPDRVERLAAFKDWSWEPYSDRWEEGFNRLRAYSERHGTSLLKHDYVEPDGYRLATWATLQRVKKRDGELSADRVRRLEELPGWLWDPRDTKWDRGFSLLEAYANLHGNTLVPGDLKVDGYPLGSWITRQRHDYINGSLDADRCNRLQSLPGWTATPDHDRWEDGFAQLMQYVEVNGDALVPTSYVIDGYKLGNWVISQRQFHAKGRLSPDREQRLQEVAGWAWNVNDIKWDQGYRRLLEYVKRHGDARVPRSHVVEGFPLGKWVDEQRRSRRHGKLRPDRQHKLEQLAGWP